MKTPIQRSRSSKVVEFGGNQKVVYDCLLVINSNIGAILHQFFLPPSHLVLSFRVTSFEFMEKLYGS